jgi:lysozyme
MNYSKDGLVTLTEQFEGCRLVAYQDQVGVWTIGYGHTKNVKQGDICTQAQAEAFLLADVQECVDGINAHAKVQLTQRKFDALVDFAFNLGLGALDALEKAECGRFRWSKSPISPLGYGRRKACTRTASSS